MNTQWRKSSYSDMWERECVEVAELPDGIIGIRDSKHPTGGNIRLNTEQWSAFCSAVRSNEI